MKLFKAIIPIIILLVTLSFLYTKVSIKPDNKLTPFSIKNEFHTQLNYFLNLAEIKTHEITIRDFQNEIEFYIIKNSNGTPTKIILSTSKNPYQQVASLQQIFKIAKIKEKNITFIDLSINHPYATFQNY